MAEQSWTDVLQDIAKNGVSEAVDRFIGPDSAYEPTYVQAPSGGQGTQDQLFRPVDNTPGEPTGGVMAGYTNTQLAVGGLGVALAVGLIVYLARS